MPRYKDIKQQMIESLRRGKWRHGQAIPSEPLLAKRFAASIGTIRKAIGELEAERILVREQGRGTFVVTHNSDYMLNVFFQIVDKAGRKELPRSRLLSFDKGPADAATAQRLQLPARAAVFRIKLLQALDGEEVIVDHLRLPASHFPDLRAGTIERLTSTLYEFYQVHYGINVLRLEEQLSAELADADTCRLLRLKQPAPVLKIVRTAYTYKDVAVDTRVRYVQTRNHRYQSLLGRAA